MKKTYMKPYIAIDSFQLDAAFAEGCSPAAASAINFGENDCGIGTGTRKQFYYFNNVNCDLDLVKSDGDDALCYHGPTAAPGITFFQS